jgi:hypothetical protein
LYAESNRTELFKDIFAANKIQIRREITLGQIHDTKQYSVTSLSKLIQMCMTYRTNIMTHKSNIVLNNYSYIVLLSTTKSHIPNPLHDHFNDVNECDIPKLQIETVVNNACYFRIFRLLHLYLIITVLDNQTFTY